jgi:hypothetical protein
MGRKWRGVTNREYDRLPHSTVLPPSLWWYRRRQDPAWADDVPSEESQSVIDAYLRQCARGRALPLDFEETVRRWLQDLTRQEKATERRTRFWTLPAYALKNGINPKTMCKRLREMEKIAKQLLPHRVPPSRNSAPLTEEVKQEIRQRYLASGGNPHTVATEMNVDAFRVGQICRREKAELADERERLMDIGAVAISD